MNKQFDKEKKECYDHWNSEDEDDDNSEYDNRYTRPEASWKQMLFQQPPTSHVGVIYYEHWWAEPPLYTRMRFLKPDNDTPRLKDIAPALDDGPMVSDHAPCVLWLQPSRDLAMLHAVIMCEEYYAGNIPTPALLRHCGFLIYEDRCGCVEEPALHEFELHGDLHDNEPRGARMTRWMDSLGKREIDKDNYRQETHGSKYFRLYSD